MSEEQSSDPTNDPIMPWPPHPATTGSAGPIEGLDLAAGPDHTAEIVIISSDAYARARHVVVGLRRAILAHPSAGDDLQVQRALEDARLWLDDHPTTP